MGFVYIADNDVKGVADYWGTERMPLMVCEEAGELIQAVSKYNRNPTEDRLSNVVTEIADLYIALGAYAWQHEISDMKIKQAINKKLSKKY